MTDLNWLPKIQQNEFIKKLKKNIKEEDFISLKTFFRLQSK